MLVLLHEGSWDNRCFVYIGNGYEDALMMFQILRKDPYLPLGPRVLIFAGV